MPKPSKFPQTDSKEQDSITALYQLLDSKILKAEIKSRDKYPNIDGYIEIVNDDSEPIGKVEVQVKYISKGDSKYSCQSSLVGYSEVSTLPIILICVDPQTPRAYWKHVHDLMPEYIPGQDSFTIKFSNSSDLIDQKGLFIQKWLEIVGDYQERIKRFPTLKDGVIDINGLEKLEKADKIFFQKFIGNINRYLDNEFISTKRILFPDVWKLGVGIFSTDQDYLKFQVYKIPYGETDPLIAKLEGKFSIPDNQNNNAISDHFTRRDYLEAPEELAKEFVLDKVETLLEQRAFPIYGKLLSEDMIIGFIDKYHQCLSVEKFKNSYEVSEIEYAINHHLIGICGSIIKNTNDKKQRFYNVDLDFVRKYLLTHDIEPLDPNSFDFSISLFSRDIPMRAVFDSLNYLQANETRQINRPFLLPNNPQKNRIGWIWSAYTPDEEIRNVRSLLSNSLDEYVDFVNGNKFYLPNSLYLDKTISIFYIYEPASGSQGIATPNLKTLFIHNNDQSLPKMEIIIKTDEQTMLDHSNFPKLVYKGKPYQATLMTSRTASFFNNRLPVVNFIYRMLCTDLNESYDYDFSCPSLY